MIRDYKIGDLVIYTDKYWNERRKRFYGIFLYSKLAKIIGINNENTIFLLEFKEYIKGHDGDGKGKAGHCHWCKKDEFKLAINHLKFKKWIKR